MINAWASRWHSTAIRVAIAAVACVLLLYLMDADVAYSAARAAVGVGVVYILVVGTVARMRRERARSRIYREMQGLITDSRGEITPLLLEREPFPTLVALLKSGELLLVDWDNDFDFRPVPRSCVVGAQVERKQTAHSRTRHSGRSGVGMTFGSGLTVASAGGGRSTTTTQVVEDAVVEIRVQREPNGPVSCHTFAFGRDVSGAETMAAAVNRLRAAG